jgi:hypothetical protein
MIKESGAVLITKSQVIVTEFTFVKRPHDCNDDCELQALKWAASRIAYEIEQKEATALIAG